MENIPYNLGNEVHGNVLIVVLILTLKRNFAQPTTAYGYMIHTLYYEGSSGVKSSEVYDQLDMSLFPMQAISLRYKKKTIAMIEKTINDYWYVNED